MKRSASFKQKKGLTRDFHSHSTYCADGKKINVAGSQEGEQTKSVVFEDDLIEQGKQKRNKKEKLDDWNETLEEQVMKINMMKYDIIINTQPKDICTAATQG